MTASAPAPDPAAALLRALAEWLAVTNTPTAVTAAIVTVEQTGHGMTRGGLGPTQADRLAHLLATDTAVIEAHRAATSPT